jgi:hypothetical protein
MRISAKNKKSRYQLLIKSQVGKEVNNKGAKAES